MPTSRQRKAKKAQGVKATPLPPRSQQNKPGHLVTKKESVVMVTNMLNMFITSPQFTLAVQNINEYGTPFPPEAPPVPPLAPDTPSKEEEYQRANSVIAGLKPDRPPLVVVPA